MQVEDSRAKEERVPGIQVRVPCIKAGSADHFYDMLYGNSFEVITDNNSLTFVQPTAKTLILLAIGSLLH